MMVPADGHRAGWPPFAQPPRSPAGGAVGQTRADPLVRLRERYARAGTGHEQFERTLGGLRRTGEQQTNVRAMTRRVPGERWA